MIISGELSMSGLVIEHAPGNIVSYLTRLSEAPLQVIELGNDKKSHSKFKQNKNGGIDIHQAMDNALMQ